MRTSAHGLAFIAVFEGFREHAYKPVPGERYYTIGYGHYGPDVHPSATVTHARALELLRGDVRQAERAVGQAVKVKVTQRQFDALVSLCFNIGAGNFASSTVLRMTNRRRWRLAGAAFGMWVRGAGMVKLAGLVRRRAAEARMYVKHRPRR